MSTHNPRSTRRRILLYLYDCYHEDPLQMLSPADFLESSRFTRDELPANTHYLHERGLIELLIGYNPPLFAAARISTAGIDLVENRDEFDRRFPPEAKHESTQFTDFLEPVLLVAEEAEQAPISTVRKTWLIAELNDLRALLRRPDGFDRTPRLRESLHAIDQLALSNHQLLPSWPGLKQLLNDQINRDEHPPRQ